MAGEAKRNRKGEQQNEENEDEEPVKKPRSKSPKSAGTCKLGFYEALRLLSKVYLSVLGDTSASTKGSESTDFETRTVAYTTIAAVFCIFLTLSLSVSTPCRDHTNDATIPLAISQDVQL